MRYLALCTLTVTVLLSGCANPNIPDFMVAGTLPDFGPDFGGKKAETAPEVAVAPTPKEPPKPKTVKAPKPKPEAKPAQIVKQTPPAPVVVAVVAPPAPAPVVASPAPATFVGGYQPATDKLRIDSAAAFAVEAAPIGYLLKGVKSARTQVVAGTNYELCLKVRRAFRETSGWRTRLARAVVYENLQGQLELTQWSEVETCP